MRRPPVRGIRRNDQDEPICTQVPHLQPAGARLRLEIGQPGDQLYDAAASRDGQQDIGGPEIARHRHRHLQPHVPGWTDATAKRIEERELPMVQRPRDGRIESHPRLQAHDGRVSRDGREGQRLDQPVLDAADVRRRAADCGPHIGLSHAGDQTTDVQLTADVIEDAFAEACCISARGLPVRHRAIMQMAD